MGRGTCPGPCCLPSPRSPRRCPRSSPGPRPSPPPRPGDGGLPLPGAGGVVRGVRLGAPLAGAVGLALAMAGILLVEGVAYPIRYPRAFDVRPLTAAAAANVPPGGTVVGYPDLRLSYDFYLRRRVVEISDEASVRTRLATAPDDAFIMTAERWQALTAAADPAWQVLASATLRDKHMVVVGRAVR